MHFAYELSSHARHILSKKGLQLTFDGHISKSQNQITTKNTKATYKVNLETEHHSTDCTIFSLQPKERRQWKGSPTIEPSSARWSSHYCLSCKKCCRQCLLHIIKLQQQKRTDFIQWVCYVQARECWSLYIGPKGLTLHKKFETAKHLSKVLHTPSHIKWPELQSYNGTFFFVVPILSQW